MAFERGNKLSTGRPRGSLNKRTILKQAIQKLNDVGIKPLETSKEIIDSLLNNSEITIDQKIKLLQVTSTLIKYQTMDINQLANMDEVIAENEELKEEVKDLKETYIIGDAQDVLKALKQEK